MTMTADEQREKAFQNIFARSEFGAALLKKMLTCPECGKSLTAEESSYGHDCEVS